MKTTIQKNGDVTIRIKKNEIKPWRELVHLFLEAYIDPDDLVNLTESEKLALIFDGQLVRSLMKMKRKLRNQYARVFNDK